MLKALEYVLGVYALSLVVTLVVGLVIVAIRRFSRERTPPPTIGAKLRA